MPSEPTSEPPSEPPSEPTAAPVPTAALVRTGTIVEFDDPRGIGVCVDVTGERFGFHCTAIAGGGRFIEVGTSVRFTIRPGRLGRWEAVEITPT